MGQWYDEMVPHTWGRWTIVIGLLAIIGVSIYILMHPTGPPRITDPEAAFVDGLIRKKDVQGLKDAVNDSRPHVPALAIIGLMMVDKDEALAEVRELIKSDARPAVREVCAQEIGFHGGKEDVPALVDILKNDTGAPVRAAAAKGLGDLKGKISRTGAVGVLIDALDDPDLQVRLTAHRALEWVTVCVLPFDEHAPDEARHARVDVIRSGAQRLELAAEWAEDHPKGGGIPPPPSR